MPKESHNPKRQARGKSSGFIAIPRTFFAWSKTKDPYLCLTLLYLIARASTTARSFETKQGQLVTLEALEIAMSLKSTATALGFSRCKVRNVVRQLTKLGLLSKGNRISFELTIYRLDNRFLPWIAPRSNGSPNGSLNGSVNVSLCLPQTPDMVTISHTCGHHKPQLGSPHAIGSPQAPVEENQRVTSPAEEWLPIDDAEFERIIKKLPPHLQEHARQRKKINEVTRQGYGLDK